MRRRWLDHLPPWLAWGAMLSTGIFEPGELGLMALPLLLAWGVEARHLALGPYERWINLSALAFAITLLFLRVQLLPGVTYVLFLLCGTRLALPRTLGQRRQLLLMGFLLFVVAALAVFDLMFGVWLVAWLVLSMVLLMQQAWEQSARYHASPPPFRRVLPYAAGALVLGALCFMAMPRIAFGYRSPWLPGFGWGRSVSGFSDRVDLGGEGPVAPSTEVALRVVPKGILAEDTALARRQLGLLRGTALEAFEGGTWAPLNLTPRTSFRDPVESEMEAEFFLSPSPTALIPHPYGRFHLPGMDDLGILPMEGGGLRLRVLTRQMVPLTVRFLPERSFIAPEPPPTGRRRNFLTNPGEGTEYVHQWSLTVLPMEAPPGVAARALAARLQTFRYTRDNPSGTSEDPLRDFLLRTQAGHCEYFASALALMLRHRGIPTRVVNGYQLGAWVPEGGYFLVTQSEAHSWVEFYDSVQGAWQAVDPTPAAPAQAMAGEGLQARLQRGVDALKFRWERYVVRFSDADQVAGLTWLQGLLERLRPSPNVMRGLRPVGWVALAILLLRFGWRLHRRWSVPRAALGHLPQLRPLVRVAGQTLAPRSGETVRTWLARLATLRPERSEALAELADQADQTAYRGIEPPLLRALVKAECQAWRGWKPPAPLS